MGDVVAARCRECGSCLYFYPMLTISEMEDGRNATEGECRRLPPVPDTGNRCVGDWPTVQAYDWCGEHRPGSYREGGFR